METYFSLTSESIYNSFKREIDTATSSLVSTKWKWGTSPQNKQLAAVQNATVNIEKLYEDYLQYHLKVVRHLKYHCNLTLECLNIIQIMRRQGLITVLKKYKPDLGVYDKVNTKVSTGGFVVQNSHLKVFKSLQIVDLDYGVFGEDYIIVEVYKTDGFSRVGKVRMHHLKYLPSTSRTVIINNKDSYKHACFVLKQSYINELLSSAILNEEHEKMKRRQSENNTMPPTWVYERPIPIRQDNEVAQDDPTPTDKPANKPDEGVAMEDYFRMKVGTGIHIRSIRTDSAIPVNGAFYAPAQSELKYTSENPVVANTANITDSYAGMMQSHRSGHVVYNPIFDDGIPKRSRTLDEKQMDDNIKS